MGLADVPKFCVDDVVRRILKRFIAIKKLKHDIKHVPDDDDVPDVPEIPIEALEGYEFLEKAKDKVEDEIETMDLRKKVEYLHGLLVSERRRTGLFKSVMPDDRGYINFAVPLHENLIEFLKEEYAAAVHALEAEEGVVAPSDVSSRTELSPHTEHQDVPDLEAPSIPSEVSVRSLAQSVSGRVPSVAGSISVADERTESEEADIIAPYVPPPPSVHLSVESLPDADSSSSHSSVSGISLNDEEKAWEGWEGIAHASHLQRLITDNLHKTYFSYNPFNALGNQIVPIFTFVNKFRTRVHPAERQFTTVHKKYHPIHTMMEDTIIDKLSKQVDPLHKVNGIPARLGSYIEIKSSPSISHIIVKKDVQMMALERLASHIIGQSREHPTILKMKRSKKGKFSYTKIYSANTLSSLSVQKLLHKLQTLMKRYSQLHLILQPVQPGGRLYNMIKNGISLL